MKKIKVYVVDADKLPPSLFIDNEKDHSKIMGLARQQETVYSLEEFQEAFNCDSINQFDSFILIK